MYEMLRQSIMLKSDADLNLGETSGYGGVIDLGLGGSYSGGYGKDSCLTIDICPDLLFAGLAAAAAAGFAFFYMAITMEAERRRKKRNISFEVYETFSIGQSLKQLFNIGILFRYWHVYFYLMNAWLLCFEHDMTDMESLLMY